MDILNFSRGQTRIMLYLWTIFWFSYVVHCQVSESPPTNFIQQPTAGSPELQGNTKVLLCEASGLPVPVYRWKKDKKFMTQTNITDTSIKIMNIRRSDAGEYQCLASNTQGAILSNRVFLKVAYVIPFPTGSPLDLTVDQGQAKLINLPTISSYPKPSIQWQERISSNPILWNVIQSDVEKFEVTLSNDLVILETSLQDSDRMFKATAVNSHTGQRSDTRAYILKVQNVGSRVNDIPPQIIVVPKDTTAVQGQDPAAQLECVANARPYAYLKIKWFKVAAGSETLIRQDAIKYLISRQGRRLTILTPTTYDSATYKCEAAFDRGGAPGPTYASAIHSANLTVQVTPNFANRPPMLMDKDFGETVEIPCQASGIPKPTASWFRNGASLESLNIDRYKVLPSGTLQVSNASPPDSGMYQCFASNQAGEINAATWLRVLSSPPSFIRSPQNKSVIAGEDARFPCEANGAPKPAISWWRANDQGGYDRIVSSGVIQILEKELLIASTDPKYAGKYVCNATNSKGTALAAAWLTVAIRTQIVQPPQDISVIKGSTATMQCKISHDVNIVPIVNWYHNSVPVSLESGRLQKKPDGLLIQAVRSDDIGTYKCEVISEGGNDSRTAKLSVIELPHAPQIISVQLNPNSQKSVDVSWAPGFDGNSPIQKYIMQYRYVPEGVDLGPSEGWLIASSDISKDARIHTVKGLMPARDYQFRISAVNSVGEGKPSSASQTITLPQQPPSGPPRGVVASPRSNTSITVQWQAPEENHWNGRLLGYVIRYKLANYDDDFYQYINITNALVRTHEVKYLIYFEEYAVSLGAYNAKGVGNYSQAVKVRTLEGRPTAPPTGVKATPMNSTEIEVKFLPPNPQKINGVNQGYKVEARKPNSPAPEKVVLLPPDPTNMYGEQTGHIKGLMKYTDYKITVLCYTFKGDGPKSDPPVDVKTMEDVPDAVGSLTFKEILDTSMKVLWTPPPNINGILQGYTLNYMKKNETISKVTKEFAPNILTYTVTGLTAQTTYTIEVYAKTRAGPGPSKSTDIESGVPPELPTEPTKLGISNIQARSVYLQFFPGFDGKTSITKWVIEARIGTSFSWKNIYSKHAPEATSLQVPNLKPFTDYQLRMIAVNVVGASPPSQPTKKFQTIQAPPSIPPGNVTVRAVNQTSLRIGWTPLPIGEWNGDPRGYRISYKRQEIFAYEHIELENHNANSYVLSGLQEFTLYQVKVAAYNDVGSSSDSPVTSDRTREAVPSKGPSSVNATALSSTSITVQWSDVPPLDKNGLILGFKVQYGSLEEGLNPQQKVLQSSTIRNTVLDGLRKYVQYQIQVLAYTRIGDGALSLPAIVVRTFEDKPGPPSGIWFPDVTYTTARMEWLPPKEKNGIITGYRVAYKQRDEPDSSAVVDDSLDASRRDFSVNGLIREKNYVFSITAKTRLGLGEVASVDVLTMINRVRPHPPSQPTISSSTIGAREVTISWNPGSDGYGPIRNYTIRTQMKNGEWKGIPDVVPPDANSFTVKNLQPNTEYRVQIAARNDVGLGPYSPMSAPLTTNQAAPDAPPEEVKATPYTTTSVRVSWKPPPPISWNGDLLGYRVEYREFRKGTDWRSEVVYNQEFLVLNNMVLFKTYEFHVRAFNAHGHSDWSPTTLCYMEIVPTAAPSSLKTFAKSSTEVIVSWLVPAEDTHNGALLGFKIFYWQQLETQKMQIVAARATEDTVSKLRMYTNYQFVVLAFNSAGDGPNSTASTAMTLEGIPGAPGRLLFSDVSLTSLNVSWPSPEEPNGIIQKYTVLYYQVKAVGGVSKTVQVEVDGSTNYYIARDLEENVRYVFNVKASTHVGWGEFSEGNITTGPQPGSPGAPSKPFMQVSDTSVTITWSNGASGYTPIAACILQAKDKEFDKWETLMRKNDPERKIIVSFFNLRPNAEYQFRVISVNAQGISSPSVASDYLKTPDFQQKPFYQQWWFLVIVALTGLIFIIVVISLLCLTGRKNKYKAGDNILKKTSETTDESAGATEDGGFTGFEMRQSIRRSTHQRPPPKKPSYVKFRGIVDIFHSVELEEMIPLRSPPRPSPASVTYSDEEKHPYSEHSESSSLTDKPSDLDSATESQASDESEPESEMEKNPHAFVNHYVNDPIRQSWKRGQQPNKAYSYTDSEAESNYQVNLNGGQIIMNNMAGSRAPLPGFSSFV